MIPLVLVLFGYIARMARVGTVEALESDYARTAILKGLPRGVVIRRHVLRNSLLPTITVVATQTGYLIGGLVVIELLFRYNGIGLLTYNAATQHDIPMLEACVLTIGVVVHGGDARCGHPVLAAQSAHPAAGGRMSIVDVPVESTGALQAGRREVRAELLRELSALADVHDRRDRAAVLDRVRDLRARPSRRTIRWRRTSRRSTGHPPRLTGSAPTSSAATCSRA